MDNVVHAVPLSGQPAVEVEGTERTIVLPC